MPVIGIDWFRKKSYAQHPYQTNHLHCVSALPPSFYLSVSLNLWLSSIYFPLWICLPPPSLPISSLSPFLLLSALFTAKSENTLSLGGFLPFLHASDLYLEISFCPSVYLSSSFPSVRSLFFVLCSLKLSIDVLILILTFNLFIFHYYYRFERNSACGREAVLIWFLIRSFGSENKLEELFWRIWLGLITKSAATRRLVTRSGI